jgi:cytochrome c
MDSFEINKILGAFLFTCLCLLALNIGAEAVFHPVKPAKPGYDVVVTEHPSGGSEGGKPEADQPIAQLLASADASKGESSSKKCAACHTFGKGEPNRVGPNLYGVVGRPKGTEGGFAYSDAMKKKGGNWSFDDLNAFLAAPQKFIPGTKMSFAGLRSDKDRINLIAFLRSNADSPAAIPAPAPKKEAAPAAAAPAAGAAAPAAAPAGAPAKTPGAAEPAKPKAQ